MTERHASSNRAADGATHSSYPVRRKDDTLDAIPNSAAERFKVETAPDGMPAIVEQPPDATRNRVADAARAYLDAAERYMANQRLGRMPERDIDALARTRRDLQDALR